MGGGERLCDGCGQWGEERGKIASASTEILHEIRIILLYRELSSFTGEAFACPVLVLARLSFDGRRTFDGTLP